MLIGIVLLPLYIEYMGIEAYGLVGFYALLQSWFMLLDMGLTPTTARETARYRGGSLTPAAYRHFIRAVEGVFIVVAIVGGITLFFGAEYISNTWLTASELHVDAIQISVQLMAVIIALRWMCGLYRGIITGSEKIVLLSWFTSLMATLRFVGVLPVLIYISATPTSFFTFQLGVALLELLGFVWFSYRLLPKTSKFNRLSWSLAPLKPSLKFSLTIAFTTSVWVFATQSDKLVLSNILTLDEYGYYAVAVLAAGGVLLLGGPVSLALMPRMTNLEAENEHAQLIRVYRTATQFVAVIAGSAAVILWFYAEPILFAWTGETQLAKHAAPIMKLYAAGNGILAVSAFPYYLQYAKGDLRLHLIGNIIFVILLIPLVFWIAGQYGGVGAGYVWLGVNLLTFIFWLPFIHHKFEPGLNIKWYTRDTLAIFIPIILAGYILHSFVPMVASRFWISVEVIAVSLVVLLIAVISSKDMFRFVILWIRMNFLKNKDIHNV